jgi:hypothetical protein
MVWFPPMPAKIAVKVRFFFNLRRAIASEWKSDCLLGRPGRRVLGF